MHTGFCWGKPGVRRPLGRSKRKGKGNIKIDVEEIGYESVDRINVV
jgi:hypothetical protein